MDPVNISATRCRPSSSPATDRPWSITDTAAAIIKQGGGWIPVLLFMRYRQRRQRIGHRQQAALKIFITHFMLPQTG